MEKPAQALVARLSHTLIIGIGIVDADALGTADRVLEGIILGMVVKP